MTELTPLDKAKTVRLSNPDVHMDIEKATGFIRSLIFKKNKVDLFAQLRQNIPGYAGSMRVHDERDNRWYEDLTSEFKVTGFCQTGKSVRFVKAYKGAPFTLSVTMTMERDAFHWEVLGRKNSARVADRSLRVYFGMPLIAGWNVWGPCLAGEWTFDGMTPFSLYYLQQSYVSDYDVILPMASHYSKQLDVGFSIMEPIDAQVPAAKIGFLNEKCFTWGGMTKPLDRIPMLEACNYFIGLVGNRPMTTKVMLMFHEGDWRPGLGKVFKRWNKYFVPANPTMYEHEGVFGGSSAGAYVDPKRRGNESMIADWVRSKVKTFEVHVHFSYYGDYYQDGQDKWYDLNVYERLYRKWGSKTSAHEVYDWVHSHSDREILAEMEGRPVSEVTEEEAARRLWTQRSNVRKHINELADAGISPFWYFNYTDGFRPVVEKRFPDSLSKNEDGTITPSGWMMCHNLNSDPKWSFGKFQIESARKIINEHPRLAGFFLDCFRHFEVEFAHDDGITVVNNKPAYSVNFSYDAVEGTIKKMLHKKNMCTFCNKPQTIRTMRWVDGMMLEGNGDRMEEKYFWSCLAKPMVFLWTSNENSDDENCRRSVLHGCFPTYQPTEDAIARRLRYMPLNEAMRRRVFCFEPDPMRVPKSCRGKLYTVGNDYVAGIVNLNMDENQTVSYIKPPYAMFRLAKGHDIGKVEILIPGQTEFKSVPFKFNGTFIAVPLEGFSNCCVVRLSPTGSGGKKIGAEKFTGSIDSCGDPDSSFSERNEL